MAAKSSQLRILSAWLGEPGDQDHSLTAVAVVYKLGLRGEAKEHLVLMGSRPLLPQTWSTSYCSSKTKIQSRGKLLHEADLAEDSSKHPPRLIWSTLSYLVVTRLTKTMKMKTALEMMENRPKLRNPAQQEASEAMLKEGDQNSRVMALPMNHYQQTRLERKEAIISSWYHEPNLKGRKSAAKKVTDAKIVKNQTMIKKMMSLT